MKKNLTAAAIAPLLILLMTGIAMSATFSYSDLANKVNYALTLTSTGTNTYEAVFDVTGMPIPPANFHVSAFTFDFSGNNGYDISNLKKSAVSTQNGLESNKGGSYDQHFSQAFRSHTNKVKFGFDLPNMIGTKAIPDLIAFKALYLTNDGRSVKFQGWLSKDLGIPIPEPVTMILLGSGLIGLAVYGRKRFRK